MANGKDCPFFCFPYRREKLAMESRQSSDFSLSLKQAFGDLRHCCFAVKNTVRVLVSVITERAAKESGSNLVYSVFIKNGVIQPFVGVPLFMVCAVWDCNMILQVFVGECVFWLIF